MNQNCNLLIIFLEYYTKELMGSYLSKCLSEADPSTHFIYDPNAFIFSLTRNEKYTIKSNKIAEAAKYYASSTTILLDQGFYLESSGSLNAVNAYLTYNVP